MLCQDHRISANPWLRRNRPDIDAAVKQKARLIAGPLILGKRMSNYGTLVGSAPHASIPGPRPPRKTRASTFFVGVATSLFVIVWAFSGGLGGALVFLASTAFTGLYVLTTRRRSWAWLPAKKKAGAIALAVSFELFVVGAVALPRTAKGNLQAALT
jgi:hypothetical protein